MKFTVLAAALLLVASMATAQSEHDQHHQVKPAAGAVSEMVDGEVRRVDRDAQKITIRHGPIPSLDMQQPMTMVFQLRDPAMLGGLKPGDKVRFQAEHVNGAYTVTRIEPAR